ncbi:MAG: rhodanese-like domain-containing protein [Ectopseudomonas guguanensis]|uniref:rhodanese-like domain-containing protein n=1 Tax=Ectopseudomonas guguanensis TaxID=1198456 RepID=UPI003918B501
MAEHDEEFLRRAAQAKTRIVQISPQQARAQIAEGVTLLDVRSDAEFHEGHIEGALNLSADEFASRIETLLPDKQAPVVCYCRGGNRGALAADKLQQLGYTQVSSIEGGLSAFLADGDCADAAREK